MGLLTSAMKKFLVLLAILALPLIGRSQAGYIGDLINMQYGLYGVERVQNAAKHTNTTGYFLIVPESQCIVDSIWWMPGLRPAGVSQYMHTDTLFTGVAYPFQAKTVKLIHGRCLLYKNHP